MNSLLKFYLANTINTLAEPYRDEVDKMSDEEVIKEVEKIKKKESGLSSSQRERIMKYYQTHLESKNGEYQR